MTVILQHGINFEIGIILIKLKPNIQKLFTGMEIHEINIYDPRASFHNE